MNANLSRRWFIGGLASSFAAAGCRCISVPAGSVGTSGVRLTYGVISDIHVACGAGDFMKFGDATTFEKTLRWFDAQGADGVVIAGDLADNGMINQLQCVADAWFRVFPGDRSLADGRKVEKLFVYGNHDLEGWHYDKFNFRFFEKTSFENARICQDHKKTWQDVFQEGYSPIWRKNVKGYDFVGAHWVLGGPSWDGIPEVEDYFAKKGKTFDPKKPFFFIQHPHPQGTVYEGRCWGADKGFATRALSPFPNAVAFSGHSHASLTDERSVWQGAFTSIGTSSLRYGGAVDKWQQRQGMLVRVYDDKMVISRRDFIHDLPLGDDWVIPLPAAESRPFETEAQRKAEVPPQFAEGAKVEVKKVEKGWQLVIPCADGGATRAFQYEIDVGAKQKDGKDGVFTAWDAKYNMPRSMSGAPTKYLVKAELFDENFTPHFTVTPIGCFGNRGESIKV